MGGRWNKTADSETHVQLESNVRGTMATALSSLFCSNRISYRSDQVLGSGQNSAVYLGTFQKTPVAVKKIHNNLLDLRFVEIVRRLEHPNLIKVLQCQSGKTFSLLALELCAGTIEDYCNGRYGGPFPHYHDALYQMARGLNFIHSQRLVHGAVKASNVLIYVPNNVCRGVALKLSDFGCTNTETSWNMELDVCALGSLYKFFLANVDRNPTDGDGQIMDLLARMIHPVPEVRPDSGEIVEFLARLEPEAAVEFSCEKSRCYDNDETGWLSIFCVWNTKFHPSKPKLACGLMNGKIAILIGREHSAPLDDWNRITFRTNSSSEISQISWNADGSFLVSGSADGTVSCWNEDGMKRFEHLKHTGSVLCIAWNADHFVTGSWDKSVLVWNALEGSIIRQFRNHRELIRDLCWIWTDTFASCSYDKTIHVCQLDADEPLRVYQHQDCVTSIRWDNHNERLISCSIDGCVKIWSLNEDEPVNQLNAANVSCSDLCGQLVACGSRGHVTLWNLADSESPVILSGGYDSRVVDVKFSPDGRWLASVDHQGSLMIWSTRSGFHVYETKIDRNLLYYYWNSLSWNASGQKLAVANCSSEVIVVQVRPSSCLSKSSDD